MPTSQPRANLYVPRARRTFNRDNELDPLCYRAPYEKPRKMRPVTNKHGGYAVRDIHTEKLTGPFGYIENAEDHVARYGGFVVRWADFIKETVLDEAFLRSLQKRESPFITTLERSALPGRSQISILNHHA